MADLRYSPRHALPSGAARGARQGLRARDLPVTLCAARPGAHRWVAEQVWRVLHFVLPNLGGPSVNSENGCHTL